ncbi:TPA: type IV pilus biogenesis protein PilM [Salmonella enterica]|nr:type IV pilus biogenesis protein PilM [Salmonella enterica]HCS4138193.1 type IV pilus biogenesis protein PilM [Salmonella enterica]
MPLIFYLLGIFAVVIYGGQPAPSGLARTEQNLQNQLPQQARQTIAYVTALNDWRYDHPLQNGTITASQLGIPFSVHLKNQVVSNRLFDATNTDMQVTVPDVVPDGSLVCLN